MLEQLDPLNMMVRSSTAKEARGYPGGKGLAYKKIISLMPPHDFYVETHLGGATVMMMKASPIVENVGIDVDAGCIAKARDRIPGAHFICGDAVQYLRFHRYHLERHRTLIYSDPPYVLSTRTKKKIYSHEMTDDDHAELLGLLDSLDCMVMISGYRCSLYDKMLPRGKWNAVDYRVMTRGGLRTETLWFNFPIPSRLAEYGYVGQNFRDRERIKRKIARWTARVDRLRPDEKSALLTALNEKWGDTRGRADPREAKYDDPEKDFLPKGGQIVQNR